jgi:hypothetical protein
MIEAILSLPDGPDKTARIAAWIQSCFQDPTRVPILVGGEPTADQVEAWALQWP